mmetsp:Transcript_5410/g.6300  ORF Transcript_5410/g.6300 Transcript_5410/m.6300 type:complete len:203 (+) Transcript_5410:358-966(+)
MSEVKPSLHLSPRSAPRSNRRAHTSTYPPPAAKVSGVLPMSSLSLTSPPSSSNRRHTSNRPNCAAMWSAVESLPAMLPTSAPRARRILQISKCPRSAAVWRGVRPYSSSLFTATPASKTCLISSDSPDRANTFTRLHVPNRVLTLSIRSTPTRSVRSFSCSTVTVAPIPIARMQTAADSFASPASIRGVAINPQMWTSNSSK